VNIDDLVRQRMLGGEEKERAGAWLRMSELLEEEMPKERPVGLIWRRIFGGLAILLLISALSVGGYELNAFSNRTAGSDALAVASSSKSIHTTSGTSTSGTNSIDNPSTTPATADNSTGTNSNDNNNQPNNRSNNNNSALIAANVDHKNNTTSGKKIHTHSAVANKDGETAANTNTVAANTGSVTTKTVADNNPAQTKATTATNTDGSNNTSHKGHAGKTGANTIAHKQTSKPGDAKVAGSNVAETGKPTGSNEGTAKTGRSNNNNVAVAKKTTNKTSSHRKQSGTATTPSVTGPGTEEKVASAGDADKNTTGSKAKDASGSTAVSKTGADNKTQPAVAGTQTDNKLKSTTGKASVSKKGVNKKVQSSIASTQTDNATATSDVSKTGKKAQPTIAGAKKLNNSKTTKIGTLALAGTMPGTGKPAKANGNTLNAKTAATKKTAVTGTGALASSSSSIGAKTKAVTKVAKATKPVAVAGNNKTANKKGAVGIAAKEGAGVRGVDGAKAGDPVADASAGDGTDPVGDVAARKGKRVIPQLIVRERITSATTKGTNMHMDTISFADVVEYFDLPGMPKPNTPNGQRMAGTGTTANNTGNSGSSASGNGLATNTPAEKVLRPSAQGPEPALRPSAQSPEPTVKPSAQSSETESTDTKVNVAEKKSKGSQAIENLSAAFNDIKYHASGAQFAMGITGGINGTFLGANDFKGFQFGLTGKLMFSDVLILMGELKYFQRANNSYALNDNYYTYTPVAGGYSRVLVQNPYDISTLHSLEFPFTVRYCISGFNFFVGANVEYQFAINTGDYPTTVIPTTPNIVATPGNDNQPKIKANDFGSRLGMGYILGASYKVSSKVTLDLRDVQTFWDNAHTTGAKYISSQLYKSPSFQFSIEYRLGGKKKDKDE